MSILKNSSIVFIGNVIHRGLAILMLPIIARLLGPADYAVFYVSMAVCSILVMLGGLSYEASIPVSESDKESVERTLGTALIGIINGILFFIVFLFIQPLLENDYSTEIISALSAMIPIFVSLGVIDIAFQNYVSYLGKFRYLAIADIISPISHYVVFLTFYFTLYQDYRSLIISSIAASIIRIIVLFNASRADLLLNRNLISTRLLKTLWGLRNFPKYNLPSNLLNTATVHLPPVLLSLVYPVKTVGLFTMARNIITIPTHLSSKAIGQVYYPKAAKAYTETERLDTITWQTFIYSCQLTLYPAVLTAAASSFVLPILLGPHWDGVAPFIIILLPMVLVNSIQTQIGIGFLFSILRQQHKILIGNLFLFTCRISPLLLGIYFVFSAHSTIFIYSFGGVLGYTILLCWIFLTISIPIWKAFVAYLKYCFIAALCTLPVLAASLKGNPSILWISLLISIVLYIAMAWYTYLSREQRLAVISKIHLIIYKFKPDA